jgi:hypothetical protein
MQKAFIKVILWASISFLPLASQAFADTGEIAVGAKASTLGIGADMTVGITSNINLRTGVNVFKYNGTTSQNDKTFDYDLNLLSFPVLLDWHPFEVESGFRVSSGVLVNKNKVNAIVESQETYTIDGETYPSAALGILSGTVGFKPITPYVGIGWGNAVDMDSGFSFAFDLGLAFQGNPNISLAASGPVASDPTFQTALKKEIIDLKEKVDVFKNFVVLSLGVAYKF